MADWVVVFANLIIQDTNHGPHPFFLRMRHPDTGELVEGITVTDMGRKSIANDLDNARIKFSNVFAPTTSLLNKFCEIDMQTGQYRQTGKERMRIEVIGQRLLTGRLAIAESALVSVRQLFIKAKSYADNKIVNGIMGKHPLSELPHLVQLFHDADQSLTSLETFSASVEARLSVHLRNGTIPDENLVEAIGVTKIKNIEVATAMEHRLEQELGSYALMAVSGFIYKDMLLCCKFAEGDSRILLQKIARDELKRVQKGGWLKLAQRMLLESNVRERGRAWKSFSLALAVSRAPSMAEGFLQKWEMVYDLANAVCDCHVFNECPEPAEVKRMLSTYPHLVKLTIAPLLVSRL